MFEFDPGDSQPTASQALPHPLDSWRLLYFASPAQQSAFLGTGRDIALFYGLSAVALALLVLGLYLYRELSRDLREAAQRVTFVTQVSHELKTPLANIRLYSDMLQADLDEDADLEALLQTAATPVILAFTAEWCAPCKWLDPYLDAFSARAAGRAASRRNGSRRSCPPETDARRRASRPVHPLEGAGAPCGKCSGAGSMLTQPCMVRS